MLLRFVLITLISCSAGMLSAQQDPFLHRLYDSLHTSPVQKKFKHMAPMPAGVVYIQHPGDGQKEMREHFRNMKRLGFNALKQIMVAPGWTEYDIAKIALEEGIIPWWYGEGGYEEITPQLLEKLRLPATMGMEEAIVHPVMVQHQKNVMASRIEALAAAQGQPNRQALRGGSVAYEPEVGRRGLDLTDKGVELFLNWLKERYKTVEALNHAWNLQHTGLSLGERRKFSSWDDVAANWKQLPIREYNHVKDVIRFKVHYDHQRIRERATALQQFDRNIPYRAGGEVSLFHPFAWLNIDMEGVANALTPFGSFYPSMHFSWHYDLTKGEITRSMYMQAALMNDLFKGGWTGGWESTGGPQQLDGEKEADYGNSYFVDEGEVMQLFLSQLAAGFRGFGVWCWNPRSAGKEGGEYSLLDRNGQLTPRAIRLGQMANAMQKYRFELWNAHKEPTVGILYDWENEATWAAMSIPGRENFRLQPVMARIGVTRTLMDANVPFEYVTPTDLLKGLSGRYKVIYLPAQLSVRSDLLPLLHDFVRAGGQLVMDLPGAWYDQNTVLMPTGKGSAFASLFGASIDDFQYAGTNRSVKLGTDTLKGFVMNATPLGATVRARYDNGKPAVLEHALGKGTAVLLGFQASLNSFGTGNAFGKTTEGRKADRMLLQYALSTIPRNFSCNGALTYRLAGEKADHYILINDGPAKTVRLETPGYSYRQVIDAITGEKVNPASINLKEYDGRWLRLEK